jgi:hypothetical protein
VEIGAVLQIGWPWLPKTLLHAEIHAINYGALTGDEMFITLAETNRAARHILSR